MKKMLTKELSKELKKREGVISITVEPYEKIEVGGIRVDGPAVILINQVIVECMKKRISL